jgi:hypothetical protein
MGKSGRALLDAIVSGEDSPERLAGLAPGKLRSKFPQLQLALEGRIRGAAAGDHPYAHLPLREEGLFAAGETHVAGERKLAAVASRPTADKGDGGNWRAGQTHEKVRPGWQACGTGRH